MSNQKSLKAWVQSGKVNRKLCIFTFMLVPVALLVIFTYIPFIKMIGFSFYDMKYIGDREFVGLQNYVEVFTRKDCFQALKLSLYYIAASFIQLGLALYFASVLSFRVKGSGVFKGLMRWDLFLNFSIPGGSFWIRSCSGAASTWSSFLTG